MNKYLLSLDKNICDKIDIDLYYLLTTTFTSVKILDVEKFEICEKYEPCVSSIFVVSEGGSYYDGDIEIYNGTLSSIKNVSFGSIGNKYMQILKFNCKKN
jgi:hypothetical protein